MIVILSDKSDAHLPYVTRHLKSRYIIVDPSLMQHGRELTYAIKDGSLEVSYDGKTINDEVTSVWLRKPQDFTIGVLPVREEYAHYAASASQGHADILRGLFPNALWISDYFNVRRAGNKARQLQVAHQLGFNVPDTLMTSSAEAALNFMDQHGTVIVKTLAKTFPYASDLDRDPVAFFAKKLTVRDKNVVAGLQVAPAIFQQAIDVAVDIRVNVVGEVLFAASIRGSAIDRAGSAVRDWRIAHCEGDMVIEEYNLPSDVASKCVAFIKEMGLRFGAFDLVKDKEGTYWFLENNPNGQWAFVEDETGQSIGRSIAELLEFH